MPNGLYWRKSRLWLVDLVSIAVDPIAGTRMTSMGKSNAISVLFACGINTLLKVPDMYKE